MNGLRFICFLIIFGNIYGRNGYSIFSRKFIGVTLEDGFRELRIAYKRILVLEVSAFLDTPEALVLRRITDGKRLVQLVFQHGELKDCEYTQKGNMILNMLGDFTKAKQALAKSTSTNIFDVYSNMTLLRQGGAVKQIKTKSQLREFEKLVDFKSQARKCHIFYARAKRKISQDNNRTLRKHKKGDITGARSRSRRELFSGWLIFPGTKWCGQGDVADSFDDLGYDVSTDTCCRNHDNCPHIIDRFAYKYSLFNYMLHTMSHCGCDKRFRKCLRRSKSSTAKLVGQIYFNIIGPQCFKFSKEKVCKKRTWWGTCKKYGKLRIAHPHDNKKF